MSVPVEGRRDTGYRRDLLWLVAIVHRISGVLLACFLPLHFLALGLALEGEAKLEGFLRWTDEKNLTVCMNLHPASGIQPHETAYPAMAKAMGSSGSWPRKTA